MLESILSKTHFHPVIKCNPDNFVAINLSQTNNELSKIDLKNTVEFANYINTYLIKSKATVAIGGYNEPRNIYKRSTNFNNNDADERFIHLGIDLWTSADTPVYSPLKGTIHSFNNNKGLGNYGPTIILEHSIENQPFYTLYGHLTTLSLNDLFIGKTIGGGEVFAAIGNYPDNGDYPPHLHFQIIKNIGNYLGDFPGVTSLKNQEKDLANCPNPNLILRFSK